jgi:hypothetical protein
MRVAASSGPPSPGGSVGCERRRFSDVAAFRLREGFLKYVQFRAKVSKYHQKERNSGAVFHN